MKKIISLLLCLCFALTPVCAYAAQFPDETLIMMGDVNCDGEITASDARTALRISADLEEQSDLDMLSIDTDANGEITAADARNILRKSASLSEFSAGFDGAGVANALKALRNGRYTIYAETEEMDFTMVIDGENIYLETSDFSFSLTGDNNSTQTWTALGVMYLEDEFYITFNLDGKKCAWLFSEAAIKMLENSGDGSFNVDEIFEIANVISALVPEEFDAPEKTEKDGEAMYCYKSADNNSVFYVDAMGRLKQIMDYSDGNKLIAEISIDEFSADVSSAYFDLSRFDEIQMM
ncbi:MAG: dockerin type I repeat-containing protein [Clostridia bacterium]|nr:dockerin type I repeat-containing protein [Clostridia bacterium]